MPHELSNLIQQLFTSPVGGLEHGAWRPAADVYRTRDGWLIKVEVAGIRPEDIQLTVQGRRLVIVGKRRDSAFQENCECYSLEISYSRFERQIEFPYALSEARILTEYRDGMLTVRVLTAEGGAEHRESQP